MNDGIQTISGSTIVSIVLHAAIFAIFLQWQYSTAAQGSGLNIELISSHTVSDQDETDEASKSSNNIAHATRDTDRSTIKRKAVVVADHGRQMASVQAQSEASSLPIGEQGQGTAELSRSTSASQQTTSILDLLHTSISASKQYPYQAKRQRREGVATVLFTLYPDGTIDAPVLLKSSKTRSLDRAALTAVTGITPFLPAADYLEQAKSFQVDVVFKIL